MRGEKKPLGIRHFLLYFFSIFIVSSFLAFSILQGIEKEVRAAKLEETKLHEEQIINLELEILGHEFRMIIADLQFLKNVYDEDYFVDEHEYQELLENWAELSFQRGIYDQIRMIDADGFEKIRVDYLDGIAYVVEEEQLQDKSDRYYFQQTAMLGNGGIYISPMDLNVENDEIQVPYKPVMRFCTPIYSDDGEFQGIVVLNYLAENLLSNFKEIAKGSYGEIALLNTDGDWLSSTHEEREWNFMFEDKKERNFSWYIPEWELVKKGEGQEITENGLFTFSRVDLSSRLLFEISSLTGYLVFGGGTCHVVSYVLRGGESEEIFFDKTGPLIRDILVDNILLFIAGFVIALLLAQLFYLYVKAYRKTKSYSKYDSMTDVLNRRAGTDVLNKLLYQDERRKVVLSVCFIDVNGLKEVNDVLGHEVGDELLVVVSGTIKNLIREEDYIARMGGDEFVVIFSGIDAELAEVVWSRIEHLFDKINQNENRPYLISVSHGIVCYDSRETKNMTADEILKQADTLMYEEKRRLKAEVKIIRER